RYIKSFFKSTVDVVVDADIVNGAAPTVDADDRRRYFHVHSELVELESDEAGATSWALSLSAQPTGLEGTLLDCGPYVDEQAEACQLEAAQSADQPCLRLLSGVHLRDATLEGRIDSEGHWAAWARGRVDIWLGDMTDSGIKTDANPHLCDVEVAGIVDDEGVVLAALKTDLPLPELLQPSAAGPIQELTVLAGGARVEVNLVGSWASGVVAALVGIKANNWEDPIEVSLAGGATNQGGDSVFWFAGGIAAGLGGTPVGGQLDALIETTKPKDHGEGDASGGGLMAVAYCGDKVCADDEAASCSCPEDCPGECEGTPGGGGGLCFVATTGAIDIDLTSCLPIVDPGSGASKLDLTEGVHFAAQINASFEPMLPPSGAFLRVSIQDSNNFSARVGFFTGFDLIQPHFNLPVLATFGVRQFYVQVSYTGSTILGGIGAKIAFTPRWPDGSAQETSLDGDAAFEISSNLDWGIDVTMAGRWYAPLYLPNAVVEDVGLKVRLYYYGKGVFPMSLGITGN
ncbi:MAG: hypothetical protein QF464_16700, partial [Myxococcota bacterium]|nr:hypothetical protein [Myxococcota bacterium]